MGKEQISIRLDPEIIRQIDKFAANEKRTRNNMLEVLIAEAFTVRLSAINDELFEHLRRLGNENLTAEELKEEAKRIPSLVATRKKATGIKPRTTKK
jgi:hypothetical protein